MAGFSAGITALTKGNDVYYTLTWSPLTKADKYKVTASVPSVAGIFELYRMDEEKRLNLLTVTDAWYGGLRSQIRAAIDPDAASSPLRRAAVTDALLYYRYAPCESLDSFLDVVWFLHHVYFKGNARVRNSGKYSKIYLRERAPDRVRWVD